MLPERVKGVILFGTMADTGHPLMDKKTRTKVGRPPAILNPINGLCGCILRSVFGANAKNNAAYKFDMGWKEESTRPGCAARWKDFTEDHFWVCCKVDSFLAFDRKEAIYGDAWRSLCGAWGYDITKIKCPVSIHQGQDDYDMGSSAPYAPNFIKQCIPHADLEFIPGCGHVAVFGPQDLTRGQIIKAIEKIEAADA